MPRYRGTSADSIEELPGGIVNQIVCCKVEFCEDGEGIGTRFDLIVRANDKGAATSGVGQVKFGCRLSVGEHNLPEGKGRAACGIFQIDLGRSLKCGDSGAILVRRANRERLLRLCLDSLRKVE